MLSVCQMVMGRLHTKGFLGILCRKQFPYVVENYAHDQNDSKPKR